MAQNIGSVEVTTAVHYYHRKRIHSQARYHCAIYVLEPVEALLIPYQPNISKVPRQFTYVRERYAPEYPEMFTSAVEKYIRTANTYRILRFHGENGPFEDSLLCHKFECGRRHFEKQLCNLAENT